MEVSKLGDPKLRQAAAYNAIVAAQELLKTSAEGMIPRTDRPGEGRDSGAAPGGGPPAEGKQGQLPEEAVGGKEGKGASKPAPAEMDKPGARGKAGSQAKAGPDRPGQGGDR